MRNALLALVLTGCNYAQQSYDEGYIDGKCHAYTYALDNLKRDPQIPQSPVLGDNPETPRGLLFVFKAKDNLCKQSKARGGDGAEPKPTESPTHAN